MISRILPAAGVVAIGTLFLVASPAGAETWTAVGPPGGDVRALAADPRDPRRLYLGTSDGVMYRSDDSGGRWQRLQPGFPRRGVSLDDILVDPRGVLLVGFWEVHGGGGGVARSVDGGKTFTLLPGIEGEAVRALTLAPSNPNIVVAGSHHGVFRSLDQGQSWQRISPENHPDLKNIDSLAVDPRDPNIIYTGTWHLPWKTLDGGRNWQPINTGMIDDSDVMTMTVDRWNPQNIFATACSGIYRSNNAAAQWTRIRGIPSSSRRTRAFAQSPDDQSLLYAGTTEGLWVSGDASATWRLVTQNDLVVNSVVALPGGSVLLGTEGAGVVRSTDGGKTWLTSNQGFSERFVSRAVFDPVQRRVIAAIWGDRRHGGVFMAQGPRGPWSRLGNGLEGREVLSLALVGREVLAGTDDGLFLSNSVTGVWTRLATVVAGAELHPRVTDILAPSARTLLAATASGLLRSGDGGRSWARLRLGPAEQINALAVSPTDVSVVVAATPLGFFRSADQGLTWSQVSSGLGDSLVQALAFVPSNEKILFAATRRGLFRSSDQGTTWTRCTGGVPHTDLTGLAVHPDGHTIYVSDFTWGGIFRSLDGGVSWSRMPTDGLASDRVWTLSLDPTSPDRLLVASPTGGLHLLNPPPVAAASAAGGGAP
jgi:photosystem II stability/assembly factor-like uncharacterized protein